MQSQEGLMRGGGAASEAPTAPSCLLSPARQRTAGRESSAGAARIGGSGSPPSPNEPPPGQPRGWRGGGAVETEPLLSSEQTGGSLGRSADGSASADSQHQEKPHP